MRRVSPYIALATAACTSWQVQSGPPPSIISERTPRNIRVELKSGQHLAIANARLQGDSIVGLTGPASRPESRPIAVATADVARISLHKSSPVRTVFAVAAIVVAIAVIVGVSAASSSSSSNTSCSGAAA